MTYCTNRTIVKSEDRNRVAISLRCRSWTCPDCADTRKAGLIAQAIGGSPTIFLTLTLKRSVAETPEQAARILARAWRLLRLRIMRHRKWRRLPFIVVFEPHESGWPHMHLLLRCSFIDWRWLKENWLDICQSSHVYIRYAKNKQQSAAYCCKYVGKGSEKFGSCKRYWMSQDYDLRPKADHLNKRKHKGSWDFIERRFTLYIGDLTDRGWSVEYHSTHKATIRPPPC